LNQESVFQYVIDLMEHTGVTLVIIDKPHYPRALCDRLRRFKEERNAPSIVAFDSAQMPPGCVDMIIDANRDEADVDEFDGSITVALFGPQYAALAPEFAEVRRRFVIRDTFERLVISMGGSDPNFLSFMAYNAAAEIQGPMTDVVMGAAAPEVNCRRLEAAIDETRTTVHHNIGHGELADLFSNADGCIVSGGITMFEAATVGLPTIVISQNQRQLRNARRLASNGTVVNAGLFSQTSVGEIASILLDWRSSREARAELSRRASETVDGAGIDRICASISRLPLV